MCVRVGVGVGYLAASSSTQRPRRFRSVARSPVSVVVVVVAAPMVSSHALTGDVWANGKAEVQPLAAFTAPWEAKGGGAVTLWGVRHAIV